MSYQVIARKWRPQTFEEVVGQETVIRTLQNAIRRDRLAHAFLFSGVRGVGKTTTARLLAKALNCIEGPTTNPCGQCDSCLEIARSASVDVLEIDAASNTGVDNIRDLRDSVRYGTSRDRFKIFIIDEVHMLSNAAFNALLKTLEEPPTHVKFILATTEYHKIPETITSRCQQYEFKPIAFPLILERLRLIADQEEITLSDRGLRMLVSRAEGSMRDAQSALDQLIAFSGKEITDDDVRALLGVVDRSLAAAALDAVADEDGPHLIQYLLEMARAGISAQNFCRRLIEHVRVLLVCRVAGWDEELLQLADTEREAIEKQALKFSEVDLIRFYDVLTRTESELRWHPYPEVHLEMSLLKLIELSHLPRLESVLSGSKAGLQFGHCGEQERNSQIKVGQKSQTAQTPTHRSPESTLEKTGGNGKQKPSSHQEQQPNPGSLVEDLLGYIQEKYLPIHQVLKQATKISLTDDALKVRYSGEDGMQAEMLQDADRMEKLRTACTAVLGSSKRVLVEIEETKGDLMAEDPMENPKIKMVYDRYPGKVIVKKEKGN